MIKNRFNLPQPFVDAVTYDGYTPGDAAFTTTGLLRPARISALQRRHQDQMEEEASEMVWRLSGQARHVIMERIAAVNPERYLVETRLYTLIDGHKIGGQIDLYDKETSHLYDWKETSIWKIQLGDFKEWEAQANINALLCRRNGLPVNSMSNIALLKDWKKRQAQMGNEYPESPVRSCPLEMWPEERTIEFIRQRITAHVAAEKELPQCTDEERWARPEKWAVVMKGKKRALKLHDSEVAATEHAEKVGGKVEHRPGEWTRCEFYCPVVQWCSMAREYFAQKAAA